MASDLSYQRILIAAQHKDLHILGAIHPRVTPVQGAQTGTLILLGLIGEDNWSRIIRSDEFTDGAPDPLDRWSLRTVGDLATDLGASAHYPFGGPPFAPFVDWALASGRAFTSPSQMLVHDTVGLLISYRGALHLRQEIDIPKPVLSRSPCDSCTDRPCLRACPAHALVDGGPYNLSACHDQLDTPEGTLCLSNGCLARLACPFSQGASRDAAQSAHHMSYFHKT